MMLTWGTCPETYGHVFVRGRETHAQQVMVCAGSETHAQQVTVCAGSGDPRTAGHGLCGVGRPTHSRSGLCGRETHVQHESSRKPGGFSAGLTDHSPTNASRFRLILCLRILP